jgi:ceramide glucosyltransferase
VARLSGAALRVHGLGPMGYMLDLLADLSIAGALLGCACTLIMSVIVLRFRPLRRTSPTSYPPVTILKPLDGTEPDLYTRLASFCSQDYPGPIEIICGVQTSSDPAIDVVQRLQARFPEMPIALHIDARQHGYNRKISNLINILALARHDTLVMCDSDVEVGPDYLAEVVATLDQPNVGAVTFLYHGIAAEGIANRLAALAINTHFLPQVMAALLLRLAQPCLGPTIAIRRRTLDEIGGLRAFADVLAEDHAIGKAVRDAGLEVAFASGSIGHVCCASGMLAALARELRVARTIKVIDPIGYDGTVLAHPFALGLLAALLGASSAGAVMAGALVCRMVLCLAVQRAFRLPPQPYWLIPFYDLAAFAIYLVSFAGSRVTWRRYKYRVASDGTLVEQPTRAG